MLSIAYGAAYGQTVGWLMFVVVFGLLALVMTTCSPLILVSDILEVDHARMPLSHIGVVLALNPQQTQAARRSRDHDLDYTLVKLWASTSSVSIRIHDPKDPHPGWLISSRNDRAKHTQI